MVWLTGDEHYNHENILTKFIFRPFPNVAAMNAEIVHRHNERVKPSHTVIHVGDFRMTNGGPKAQELLALLNGKHIFIDGNHDRRNGVKTPITSMMLRSHGKSFLVCHNPEIAQEILSCIRFDFALVAHVHLAWKFRRGDYGDMINVGVDQWDFYPVNVKQILKAYSDWMAAIDNTAGVV